MTVTEIEILVAGIIATLPSKKDRACIRGYWADGEWHNECGGNLPPIHRISEHKREESGK